jgi:hypothetical protein
MFATILGWFTSGIFSSVVSEIGTLWTSYLTAKTDAEKAAIMERIRSLQDQRDLQIAEAGQRINAIVLAGHGTTDDLSSNLWYVAMTVIGFYFLHWTVGQFTGK